MATLLSVTTTTAVTGTHINVNVKTPMWFSTYLAGAGALTATVVYQGTNDPTIANSWQTFGTSVLSVTTNGVDSFQFTPPPFVRAALSTATGTLATLVTSVG